MTDKIQITLVNNGLGKDDVLAAILAEQAGSAGAGQKASTREFVFSVVSDAAVAMQGEAAQSDVWIMPAQMPAPTFPDTHAPLCIRIAQQGESVEPKDDIVFTKPLRLAQLLDTAISGAKLRRRKQPRALDATHVFHPFARMVEDTQSQRSVTLTEKEASFLCAVLEAGQKGLLRKDAMTELWGYHPDAESHAVDTTLYRLRQKLQELGSIDTHLINEGGIYKWRDA